VLLRSRKKRATLRRNRTSAAAVPKVKRQDVMSGLKTMLIVLRMLGLAGEKRKEEKKHWGWGPVPSGGRL